MNLYAKDLEEARALAKRLSPQGTVDPGVADGMREERPRVSLPLDEAKRIADLLDTLPKPLPFKRGDRVRVREDVAEDLESGPAIVLMVDQNTPSPYLLSLDSSPEPDWFSAARVTTLPAEKEASRD